MVRGNLPDLTDKPWALILPPGPLQLKAVWGIMFVVMFLLSGTHEMKMPRVCACSWRAGQNASRCWTGIGACYKLTCLNKLNRIEWID